MRILIVDDSLSYRLILRKVLSKIGKELEIESVNSGEEALEAVKANPPDAILLDLTLPGIDGIETLRRIKAGNSKAEVIVISGVAPDLTEATFRALNNGALDFVAKPDSTSAAANEEQLTTSLRSLIEVIDSRRKKTDRPPVVLPKPIERPVQWASPRAINADSTYSVVVVGVSTGGPAALNRIVPMIPANFPVPIIIVQHMPPHFTAHLAAQLDKLTSLKVQEAAEGAKVTAGNIYIAPGGIHLKVIGISAAARLQLEDSAPVNSCKPAVDVLFESAVGVYGNRILATVLTGMGNDGAKAATMIKNKGGMVLVQDEESSVVWGMPGAVVRAGSADEILPLDKIVGRWVDILTASIK